MACWRIVNSGIIMAAVLASAARAQPAPSPPPPGAPAKPPGDHVLKLTNSAKAGIVAVYVAPAGSHDMSDDLLGKQTANAGKTVTLKVKDPLGTCVFDLQFLMNDGGSVDRKGVNLCQSGELTLTP